MTVRPIVGAILIASIALGPLRMASVGAQGPSIAGCPVTVTSASAIPPPTIDPAQRPAGENWRWYGNASIWVQLPPDSTLRVAGADAVKMPWWRVVPGRLTISGHPVGKRRPHLRARIPSGYRNIGFQSTGISFPSHGCWRVTGHVGGASLSFVVRVTRAGTS